VNSADFFLVGQGEVLQLGDNCRRGRIYDGGHQGLWSNPEPDSLSGQTEKGRGDLATPSFFDLYFILAS